MIGYVLQRQEKQQEPLLCTDDGRIKEGRILKRAVCRRSLSILLRQIESSRSQWNRTSHIVWPVTRDATEPRNVGLLHQHTPHFTPHFIVYIAKVLNPYWFTEDLAQFTVPPIVFLIMSSLRAVRRLLQQTSDVTSSDQLSEKEQQQQRRRKLAKQVRTPVDEKEVVNHHINFLLMMDGAMASSRSKKKMTEARLLETQVKTTERSAHCATKVLGNSRSSSSTVTHKKGPPTFNKKRHQKQKEEKSMAKIAQLLKKAKANKNNQKVL